MSSVVNLLTFANASHVPIVVLVDMQQDYLTRPRPIDAFHRNHKVTYLRDASASHRQPTCRRTKSIAPFAGFSVSMERYMKQPTGSPRPYLASSVSEKTRAANLERRSQSVLAALENCRAVLLADADHETAQLVTLAILQLRMKLNRVGDAELKALCDAMTQRLGPVESQQRPPQGGRVRFATALKLIK